MAFTRFRLAYEKLPAKDFIMDSLKILVSINP